MATGYSKPFLTIVEQISLLESRGLEISDIVKAHDWLHRLGYYRLAAYLYPMRESSKTSAGDLVVLNEFQVGSSFELAAQTYVFDKQLRILFLDAVERIEIAVRAEVSRQLGARDPFGHLNPNAFSSSFTKVRESGTSKHQDWVAGVEEALSRSTDDFAVHFREKYDGKMPIWVSSELWDLGRLANLVSGLNQTDKKLLASKFGVENGLAFENWLHHINSVRNICAHHGRLWNRNIAKSAKKTAINMELLPDLLKKDFHKNRIGTTAQIVCNLLAYIQPNSSWPARYVKLNSSFENRVLSNYPWVNQT